ncbi:MAG: gene transfer agent family protein [Alphaproteobacteria bacterium]|nr:gene transfer agent family protein [Alphaproteobacteria bacterium]
MINTARGEVGLVINGERRRLCLTLGALAEIEALPQGLKSSERVLDVLVALLRGGNDGMTRDALQSASFDPEAAVDAIITCFELD